MNASISRRRLLVGAGRGAIAVVVLGVVACGSADDAPEAAGPSASGSAPEPLPSSSPVPAGPGVWTRVDLGIVAAYVLVRGKEAAVVDTGEGGSADQIGESLKGAGSDWAAVKHVVVTHYHGDHAGSMPDVMQRATAATGYAGELDLPSIGSPRPLKPAADGQDIFGLQVLATPGHTAGHISLFDPETGVLVAGDALTNTAGLAGSNPSYTADETQALATVQRLAQLPVRTIYVGHGPPVQDGAAAALRKLATTS